VEVLVTVLALVRFKPKGKFSELTLAQYATRRVLFGKAGTELPPVVPSDLLVRTSRKFGPWQRHLFEKDLQEKMGSIFTILRPFSSTDLRLMVPVVWVSDPGLVKKVMTDKETYYTRGYTGFTNHVGEGLLGLPSGPVHSHHRRVVSQFLSEKYIKKYASQISEKTDVILDKWSAAAQEKRSVNAYYDFSVLTLDIIMYLGMGIETDYSRNQLIPDEENINAHDLDYALKHIVAETAFPPLGLIPDWRIKRTQVNLNEMFEKCVEVAKKIDNPDSMLGFLLTAKNPDGSRALTDKEAMDEFKTIRGAGHETTSNTLCFILKYLSENPDKLSKLREEVDAAFDASTPTYEQAKSMKYAYAVMLEALRMNPTVPSFPRIAREDTELGGYMIPKESFVFVSQYPMNRSKEIWGDPDVFRPERFLEPLPELHPSKPIGVPNAQGDTAYGFLPFGAGARSCAGARIAMIEAVMILTAIVKKFDVALDKEKQPGEIHVISDVTMGPKQDGLWLRIAPREQKNE